jgi:hypothetical protein
VVLLAFFIGFSPLLIADRFGFSPGRAQDESEIDHGI